MTVNELADQIIAQVNVDRSTEGAATAQNLVGRHIAEKMDLDDVEAFGAAVGHRSRSLKSVIQ